MSTYAARLERAFTGPTAQHEITRIMAFVNECAKQSGRMVNGNQLAIKANDLLGRGAVVAFVESDDSEGGHHD